MRYREALWAGYADILKMGNIDLELIIKVYQQIKNTNERIRPPHSLTTIKRGQSEFKAGEVIYTPPRGKGEIEQEMRNMFQFLNSDNENLFDPLLKMVIAHYQFEAIHPFTDGNGRTGLYLTYFI